MLWLPDARQVISRGRRAVVSVASLVLLSCSPGAPRSGAAPLARSGAAPLARSGAAPLDQEGDGAGAAAFSSVAIGRGHLCAQLADRRVACWGESSQERLGQRGGRAILTAAGAQELTSAVGLAVGAEHACARLGDGTVRCWGQNDFGQLGDGTNLARPMALPVKGLADVAQIASGANHTCAVLRDGTARCWGDNGWGQLGDGSVDPPLSDVGTRAPVPPAIAAPSIVPGLAGALEIRSRGLTTCVLVERGAVQCWGEPIGLGAMNETASRQGRSRPVPVRGLAGATLLALGPTHSCALLADRTVACWGDNGWGALGDGTVEGRSAPVAVAGLSGVVEIAAGMMFTCARLDGGGVRCWGYNGDGQLGDGTKEARRAPTPVAGLTDAVGLVAGELRACARRATGAFVCWGDARFGTLGPSSEGLLLRPTPLSVKAPGGK